MSATAVATVSRFPLAVLPTPLTEAPRLADAVGVSAIFVKRDDLTGFAVAGNKARQLEFLVAEALAAGADTVVTGGTPGSNFIQATAAAAAAGGLRCVLVIAGPERPAAAHPNLAAAVAWGARLRWTDDPDRSSVDTAIEAIGPELRAQGAHPHVLPRGGATATGALAYRCAVDELLEQLPGDVLVRRPVVVVPTGSGGTLAGIVAGLVARGRLIEAVGASVSRPPADLAPRILGLARQVAERCGEPPPVAHDISLVDARGPGHGVPSSEGAAAAEAALRGAGLVLDPVYTAKGLAVLPAASGGRPAVFWHTGGLMDAVAGLLEGDA